MAVGIIRDVLLQNYGIYALQKPILFVSCAIVAVVAFYFGKLVTYLDPIVKPLDNISVALWTVIGTGKALSAGLDVVPSIILGTITAIGGGISRDVFMNREPEAFQAGTLNNTAALVGATAFAVMKQNHILENWAAITCVALVLVLRYAAILFGWRTTPPKDYSDTITRAVTRPVITVANKVRPPKGKLEREKERELQRSGKLFRVKNRKHDNAHTTGSMAPIGGAQSGGVASHGAAASDVTHGATTSGTVHDAAAGGVVAHGAAANGAAHGAAAHGATHGATASSSTHGATTAGSTHVGHEHVENPSDRIRISASDRIRISDIAEFRSVTASLHPVVVEGTEEAAEVRDPFEPQTKSC